MPTRADRYVNSHRVNELLQARERRLLIEFGGLPPLAYVITRILLLLLLLVVVVVVLLLLLLL